MFLWGKKQKPVYVKELLEEGSAAEKPYGLEPTRCIGQHEKAYKYAVVEVRKLPRNVRNVRSHQPHGQQ